MTKNGSCHSIHVRRPLDKVKKSIEYSEPRSSCKMFESMNYDRGDKQWAIQAFSRLVHVLLLLRSVCLFSTHYNRHGKSCSFSLNYWWDAAHSVLMGAHLFREVPHENACHISVSLASPFSTKTFLFSLEHDISVLEYIRAWRCRFMNVCILQIQSIGRHSGLYKAFCMHGVNRATWLCRKRIFASSRPLFPLLNKRKRIRFQASRDPS